MRKKRAGGKMKIYIVGSLNMDLVIKAPFMPENGVTISGKDL